jgi:hypothetical protein
MATPLSAATSVAVEAENDFNKGFGGSGGSVKVDAASNTLLNGERAAQQTAAVSNAHDQDEFSVVGLEDDFTGASNDAQRPPGLVVLELSQQDEEGEHPAAYSQPGASDSRCPCLLCDGHRHVLAASGLLALRHHPRTPGLPLPEALEAAGSSAHTCARRHFCPRTVCQTSAACNLGGWLRG